MFIHLDFESRSEVEIKTAGAYIYATHPSTELTCMRYSFANGPVEGITWDDIQQMNVFGRWPEQHNKLIEAINAGVLVKAFNAFFEELIWEHIVTKKYQWKTRSKPDVWEPIPNIPLAQWRCVMAKSLAHSLPQSLANVSVALNTEVKKDLGGYRIMLKVAKPKPNWEETGDKWNEHPLDFEKLYDYCGTDVESERVIDGQIPELNDFEQYVWYLDQTINKRGVRVDLRAIKKAKEFIDAHSKELYREVFEVSEGFVDKISKRALVLDWLKSMNIPLEDLKKKTVGDALKNQLPANVRRMLELRLELGKTSLAKYDTMMKCVGEGDRIRDVFIYHGASTGRWTGKLVQMHNLPKGNVKNTDQCIEDLLNFDLSTFEMFYPDVMDALSSCIRGMFIPAEGHDFLVADYAAIEARVVFWLANEYKGLEKFRKGEDLYVDMARVIYVKDNISKLERQLGKAAVLGCGYGMGHVKFRSTCDQWGIPVDEPLAQRVVSAYRETYRAVVEFWYATEAAAKRALSHKETIVVGRTRWSSDNKNLYCTLPSGRVLTYNQAALGPVNTSWGDVKEGITFWAIDGLTKRWTKTSTYGGKLVENITQAVARDILANAMLEAEAAGYPVAFSVHDEIVSEPKEGFGTVEEFERIISTIPPWAEGCPITAEGYRGKRYKK